MEYIHNWILLALLGPFFWTLSDFIDKFVIDTYIVGTFDFLFSFAVSSWGCLLILLFFFGIPAFTTGWEIAILLGFATTASFYFYAKGLQYADTSLAILTFKFVPILAMLFAYLLYSEKIYSKDIIASVIVILGGVYLFLRIDKGKLVFNKGLPWILIAVAMWAFIFVVAGQVLQTMSFSEYMVLDTLGASLICIPLWLFKPSRKEIKRGLKQACVKKYFWFFLNTFTDFIAQVMIKKSFALAPSVSLVSILTQVQSIYGIIFGVFLTIFFPRLIKEDITSNTLSKKLIGSTIIIFGVSIAILY